MLRPWIVLLLALGLPSLALGQADRIYRPNWVIKYNPLALFLNYTPGIELGLEHTVRKNTSLHLGASFLNDFGFSPSKNFEGYKILSEYRRYQLFQNARPNTFLSLQLNFKQTFANGRTFLDRANGNYQQLSDVDVTNTTFELLGGFGLVSPLNSWLSLDFSAAAGIKWLEVTSDNIPADAGFGLLAEPTFLALRVRTLGEYLYPLLRFQFKVNVELFRD